MTIKRTLCAVLMMTAVLLGSMSCYAADDLSGVTQNWDKTLPANDPGGSCPDESSRFTCVMNNAAVRDNETGLVWEQSPATATGHWASARDACALRTVGNRYGWRLPSIVELTSLLTPGQTNPALPAGHPFSNVVSRGASGAYWSATAVSDAIPVGSTAWAVFFDFPDVGSGVKAAANFRAWCVRGGMNEHQY